MFFKFFVCCFATGGCTGSLADYFCVKTKKKRGGDGVYGPAVHVVCR